MRHRQHHPDHAPRRVLNNAQPGGVAARLGVQRVHAQHKAHIGQLQNLVVETADLGLLELHLAQLFAPVVADAANNLDDALAIFERHRRHFLLRLVGRVHRLVHGGKHAVARG